MTVKLLLTEDVEDLGRSGEIITARPGHARNKLLPLGLAVIADKKALRMQERLQETRKEKAKQDRQESEETAKRIEGQTLIKSVKVDGEGHMYGSVTILDIVHQLEESLNINLDKRYIQLKQPIKELGVFNIVLKLKEEVTCSFTLKVISEAAAEDIE